MSKIVYAKKEMTIGYGLAAQLAAAAIVLFPLSLQHTDYRSGFADGLKISAHKASPAYAAFEDLHENYSAATFEIPDNGIVLTAGKKFDFHPQVLGTRQVRLAGLSIRLPARETKPVYVATNVVKTGYGKTAPLSIRKQQLIEELTKEDWTLPTVAEKARELAQNELAKSSLPKSELFRAGASASVIVRPASVQPKPIAVAAVAEQVADAQNFAGASLVARGVDPSTLHPLILSGNVEMTGGLAFVGPETQFAVKHIYNGQTLEQGRIWVTEGRFEIQVKEPSGFLVAQLQSTDGRILGEGEINLLDISDSATANKIGDIRISLHPTSVGATFRTISSYAGGAQKVALTDAKVEIQAYSDSQKVNAEGFISDPTLTSDSTFVARATAKKRWPTLFVGQAQVPQDIRLFEKSMIEALISLNSEGTDRAEAFHSAVVWGQVRQGGKAVTHAQVELAGEYKPIYFNEAYLPDPKLSATSANGLFAFISVAEGTQALRVHMGQMIFPAQIFPTQLRHVSYLDIDVHGKVTSQFKVFDPLDQSKVTSARIRMFGNDDVAKINKDDFVEYRNASNPFLVESEAGSEYEVTRATVSGTPHEIYLPMVSKQWLFQKTLDAHIQVRPDRGTVVGYIDDAGFEVEMTGYPQGESAQVVYFDAQGKILTAHSGVAGGGFVIFNAPIAMQTVIVHTPQKQTFSQVLVAEPGFVQVVTH